MPLLIDALVRIIASAAIAFGLESFYPIFSLATIFNITQCLIYLSFCAFSLRWHNLLLVGTISEKYEKLKVEAASRPVHQGKGKIFWPAIEQAKNGFDLSEAIVSTPVEKLRICKFAEEFSYKQARRVQQRIFRGLIPIVLICFVAILVAYLVAEGKMPAIVTNAAQESAAMTLQILAGCVASLWTVGTIYGEVEASRDISYAC